MTDSIEAKLLAIVNILNSKLPKNDISNIRELVQAREWGIGFENLCTQIFEYDIRIDKIIYDQIKAVGIFLELPKETWEILQKLIIE